MTINSDLKELKGVGPVLERQLETSGLKTVNDLINYFPRRYDDYSHITDISNLSPGLVSLKVHINGLKKRRARRGLHITEAIAEDETGRVKIIWFNQPYRAQSILPNKQYYLSGTYDLNHQYFQIINPSIELVSDTPTSHTARILATYRETAKFNSILIRKLISQTLDVISQLPETLPKWLVKKHDLLPYSQAIRAIHMPESQQELGAAKERLGFEELLVLMLAAKNIRDQYVKTKALIVPFKTDLAVDFVNHLPFKLTDAQRKTVWQIYKDIDNQNPMNRLVEGDVGSGKTVVAAMASLMVADAGLQVAFLAPTELLASQHAETMSKLLAHTKLSNKIVLLTGSVRPKAKLEIKKRLKNNEISIVIGTHAIFQESVDWHKLGLIIIDEQHRFGVEQRQKLYHKAGHMPHILCLTATPIPRSLALTVYGELDVSILDQSPANRAGVETSIVSPNSIAQMYDAISSELISGHQAYVVCPLITEDSSSKTNSAEKVYKDLSAGVFKNWRVGLLHGRMKSEDKDKIMQQFINHKIDVLVATTVIEVGVDVSNATVMIVESADHFGLAQLHQLRGRVGRAEHKGHCYMLMSDSSAPSKRLRAIENTDDGFELAELDLELRGPGAIYGTRQHGLLDLRIAKLTDTKLIAKTRLALKDFNDRSEKLIKYKQLADKVQRASKLTYLN